MLFDLILKRPKTVVLVFSFLTFFISLQALSLTITSDIEVYTPTEEPIVETLIEMRDEWPMDSIIIFVQSDNITQSSVLKEILAVEKGINSQNGEDTGIIYTISIASFITSLAENFPLFDTNGLPEKQEYIDFIFQYIPDEIKYQFISRDYTSAAIIVAVSPNADAETLIEQVIKPLTQKTDETQMTTTGIVAMYKETVKWTMERIVRVVPLSLFLIALVIYLFHRSIKAVVISIFTVLFSIALTFGTIGLLPVMFTPQVIAVIPLLASLGVAYSLHIISHYAEEIMKRPSQAALKRIISTTGRAILISAVTTMVGFASLLTSSMPPVSNIGFSLQ
jgi:predicted RND superfamily exporter protein